MAASTDDSVEQFFDFVSARAEQVDSLLVVGLDPHSKELKDDDTAEGAKKFCLRLIQETASFVLAYKPNSAFFERFGAEGIQALKDVIAAVPEGIPVILDVKRGDISTTADAYADAAKEMGAHAVTLNAYMGSDTVKPFIADPSKGVFVLCKTSNASSNELQTLRVYPSGKAVFEEMASLCESWNTANNVGLVVGATDIDALKRVRAAAPSLWILAPGVGKQGGNLDAACEAALDERGLGLMVPVSRGISQADDPGAKAQELRQQINEERRRCVANRREEARLREEAARRMMVAIRPYQKAFLEFSLGQAVLEFGEFKLKSGRLSPYFFNAGEFCTGNALARLGKYYAKAIVSAQPQLEYDIIFGPAYKGISLGAAVALTLADEHGIDVGFSYNRKEAKTHGEKGNVVGAKLKGKRVLIVDDVITAGTAIREAMDLLKEYDAIPVGVVIALDRQERTGAKLEEGQDPSTVQLDQTSAVQQVEEAFGIPVISVVKLNHLFSYMAQYGYGGGGADAKGFFVEAQPSSEVVCGIASMSGTAEMTLEALLAYRARYGIEDT